MAADPRLVWITNRYPPQPGGMAQSCRRQITALRSRSIPVDVMILHPDATGTGVKIEPHDCGDNIIVFSRNTPAIAAQLAFPALLERHNRHRYRAIIGFGANFPGFCAATFAAWLTLPSLILVRGNDFDRDLFDPRLHGHVHSALTHATAIGAVSPEKVRKIQTLFPGKSVVWTPNGIDPTRFSLLPAERAHADTLRAELGQDNRKIFGIFGEMKFKKRIPFWLSAIRNAGLNPRIALLIAGKLDDETQQILQDPILAPIHRHIPFQRPDQLPPLYAACDFTLIPSISEGMPNVLLEAMAAGSIPITSDAGAMPAVITHGVNGFVFMAENPGAAVQTVREALSLGEAQLACLSAASKNLVESVYTIENEVKTILDVLQSIIK